MNLALLARRCAGLVYQSRTSPVSRPAVILTVGIGVVGVAASIATKFMLVSLPNVMPLVVGVVVLDIVGQLIPYPRIKAALQAIIHGFLYLAITVVCAVLAAYAMQRFAFPLRDRLLHESDLALGFDWLAYAHWVDQHLAVQRLLHFAYNTIQIQIVLPLLVLAIFNRVDELRAYLLAFTLALGATIVISALLPAAGPIVFANQASFHTLKFTGATPLDHLTQLREAGPLIFTQTPGGIATFPSFHSTIAILTPLSLRRHHRTFMAVLVLDGFMLLGTITEGAHYLTDVIAGSAMAFLAYAVASAILRREDARDEGHLRASGSAGCTVRGQAQVST